VEAGAAVEFAAPHAAGAAEQAAAGQAMPRSHIGHGEPRVPLVHHPGAERGFRPQQASGGAGRVGRREPRRLRRPGAHAAAQRREAHRRLLV